MEHVGKEALGRAAEIVRPCVHRFKLRYSLCRARRPSKVNRQFELRPMREKETYVSFTLIFPVIVDIAR